MMMGLAAKLLQNPRRPFMIRSHCPRATYFIFGVLVTAASVAQPPAPVASVDNATEVVESPVQGSPSDPVEAAEAISSLARSGSWAEVSAHLVSAAARKPDEASLAKMVREIGPVVMPMLNRDNLLDQDALGFVAILNAAIVRENDDPQVQQLRQIAAAGTNAQVAEVVNSLVRIGNWFVADEVLAAIAKKKPDQASAADMARRIGPALLVRMSRSDKLNQPALDFVAQLSASLLKENASPDRLRNAIKDLSSKETDVRLSAMRVLLAGGEDSIRELVGAIVTDLPTQHRDELLRTIMRLGDGGVLALRQLALYGGNDERPRALASLARIDRKRFTPDLVCALHAANATDEERKTATNELARLDLSAPSVADTIVYLADDLQRTTEVAQQANGDETIRVLWEIDADRKSVASVETFASIAARRERADAAVRLLRLDSISPIIAQDSLIADVSYRVSADPLWGSPEEVKPLVDAYGSAATPTAASAALAEALRREDWTAAVGLIQFAGVASTEMQVEEWVLGQAGRPAPLVDAAIAPIPRVRYEAASAIVKLNPKSTYAGSSHVQETLSEMTRLQARPVAIIVETIPEIVSQLETLLTRIGFHVDTVVSVAELERRVASGGDLRLVLSKSGLADARPIELADRVRRLSRGGQLPIIFYTDEKDVLGPHEFSVPTVQMTAPHSTVPLTELLSQWQRVAALPPLIEGERRLYRTVGREALGVEDSASAGEAQ